MVELIVHHRWLVRACLSLFWVSELIAWLAGYGFITSLANNYTWIMLIIMFLTWRYLLEPFYAPFLKLTSTGGETVMEKSTKVLCVIIAALSSFIVVMLAFPVARATIVAGFSDSVAQPVAVIWFGFIDWIDTFRASYLLLTGVISGLILAVAVNTVVRPRLAKAVGKTPSPTAHDFTLQKEPAEPESYPTPPKPVAATNLAPQPSPPPVKEEVKVEASA